MNVLDENIPDDQFGLLQRRRIHVRKIGRDVGRKGMDDDEIIPLLHRLDRPTFFSLDEDFFDPRLLHSGYCLVHLDVDEEDVAKYVRRVLRHVELNTKAKRMGLILRVQPKIIHVWQVGEKKAKRLG